MGCGTYALGLVTPQFVKIDPTLGTFAHMSASAFQTLVEHKRVLALVHGYRCVWSEVYESYKLIENNLGIASEGADLYDLIVGFLWPGEDCTMDYPFAVANSKRHISAMADVIQLFQKAGATLDILAHSLGCYLALSAIGYYNHNGKVVNNLILQAAAVDNESIQKGEKFYYATQACNKVFVFHSKKDLAMRAYIVVEWDAPLGLNGPEDIAIIMNSSPNVKFINCSNEGLDHGDYKKNPKVFDHLASEISGKANHKQFETL